MSRHYWSPEFCDQIAELAALHRHQRAEGMRLALTHPLAARQAFAQAARLARQLRRIATWAERPDN